MAETSIPVSLSNPGQVFACLGFIEAADILLGAARGGFDWQNRDDVRFRLEVAGDENPVLRTLRFLDEANVVSLAPPNSNNCTEKWHIETIPVSSRVFPFGDPQSPATLPARLEDANGNVIVIDYWGDETRRRDNVKFWAGASGYPGAGLVRNALNLVRGRMMDYVDDPYSFATVQSSSFRFDWRRDYVPIDVGFTPNAHGNIAMQGYPVVELMAAIGISHARPFRCKKLEYSYGVAGIDGLDCYDPIFLRAALGARRPVFPGMPFRLFTMQLDWPGQKDQARCITNVIEENLPL